MTMRPERWVGYCANGACVEVRWQSACAENHACVEVACDGGRIHVRDSKDPHGPTISYPLAWWRERCAHMRRGGGLPSGVHATGDGYTWTHDRVTLRFTTDEWAAFEARVSAGEFDVDRLAADG